MYLNQSSYGTVQSTTKLMSVCSNDYKRKSRRVKWKNSRKEERNGNSLHDKVSSLDIACMYNSSQSFSPSLCRPLSLSSDHVPVNINHEKTITHASAGRRSKGGSRSNEKGCKSELHVVYLYRMLMDGLESIVVMAKRCKVAKSREEANLYSTVCLSLWFCVDLRRI